jgi:sugar phosphate isomerase/epimerase
MDNRARFVFSPAASLDAVIQGAIDRGFSRVDFNADRPDNYPATFDDPRVEKLRALAKQHGIRIGLHTLSAVNMAEITPVMHRAADEYVRENFALAHKLGADYVIFHGGYHFGDFETRLEVAIERLGLACQLGEQLGIDVFFENHNKEPDVAEIHYMPKDVAETRRFFDAVSSPRLKWAFNVGHAHLVPDGFDGFLNAFGVERIGQVRLNDTHGKYEEHLLPGQGIVDFKRVFRELTKRGYAGPFTLDFGSADDRAQWRDTFAQWLDEA